MGEIAKNIERVSINWLVVSIFLLLSVTMLILCFIFIQSDILSKKLYNWMGVRGAYLNGAKINSNFLIIFIFSYTLTTLSQCLILVIFYDIRICFEKNACRKLSIINYSKLLFVYSLKSFDFCFVTTEVLEQQTHLSCFFFFNF